MGTRFTRGVANHDFKGHAEENKSHGRLPQLRYNHNIDNTLNNLGKTKQLNSTNFETFV